MSKGTVLTADPVGADPRPPPGEAEPTGLRSERVPVARPNVERSRSGRNVPAKKPPKDIAPRGLLWWLYVSAPLSLPLAVAMLFVFLTQSLRVDDTILLKVVSQRPSDMVALANIAAAQTNWLAVFFVASVLMIPLTMQAISTLSMPKPNRGWFFAASAVLMSAIFGLASPASTPPQLAAELKLLSQLGAPDYGSIFGVFFPCVIGTCLLVAAALTHIAARATNPRCTIKRLSRLQRSSRNLLVLTSAWLIVGVTGAGLFGKVLIASLTGATATAAQSVNASSTTLFAVLYSTLLIASFGPVEFLLHEQALQRAPSLDPPKVKAWLAQQGFVATLPSVLVRAVAAASPVLASLAQTLFQSE